MVWTPFYLTPSLTLVVCTPSPMQVSKGVVAWLWGCLCWLHCLSCYPERVRSPHSWTMAPLHLCLLFLKDLINCLSQFFQLLGLHILPFAAYTVLHSLVISFTLRSWCGDVPILLPPAMERFSLESFNSSEFCGSVDSCRFLLIRILAF